jgi:Raf kinase inhibitor-like YbhB/YbcL family protein
LRSARTLLLLCALLLVRSGTGVAAWVAPINVLEEPMALHLSSSAFEDQGEIHRRYTADGGDHVPPLEVEGVPEQAKTLALVVEDPDAPRSDPFAHWVIYDIPPRAHEIGPAIPKGAAEGKNDFGRRGWGGPRPPSGRHRYIFKLYALDTAIAARSPLTKRELQRRIEGHVIEQTELVGTYARAA